MTTEHDASQIDQWITELNQTWQQGIPISAQMGIEVSDYDGQSLCCRASLQANLNVHSTMFAGSIYALATLTGWGLLHMQLKQRHMVAAIVLADAQIRYRRPLTTLPNARASLTDLDGDWDALSVKNKGAFSLLVSVFDGEQVVAEFTGKYVIKA